MCDPFTIAAVSLTVAGEVVQHSAQQKQAKATRAAADESARVQLGAQNARALEETVAAAQSIDEANRQTTSVAAQARLSAIAGGVAGNSVDAVLNEVQGNLGRFKDSVHQNLGMTLLQIQRGNMGIEAQRESRINSVPAPNPWITGLAITSSVVGGVRDYKAGKPPKG